MWRVSERELSFKSSNSGTAFDIVATALDVFYIVANERKAIPLLGPHSLNGYPRAGMLLTAPAKPVLTFFSER